MTRPAVPLPLPGKTNINAALWGLLIGMFVAAVSSTVVVTSLPVIVPALGGGQATYTWIAAAPLLAMTVSTPIWGKLSDLFDRKRLFTYGILLLIASSTIAGLSNDAGMLIAMRLVQGVGAGGLAALSQIILADIVSARERGRYAGMIGAVLTTANIGGPLIGGLITDTIGWRWNFFFVLPIALLALGLVNTMLHVPKPPTRPVTLDYTGAALISAGVSLFLIWLTVGGTQFGRTSTLGWFVLTASIVATGAAIRTELRAREPLLPLSMFRNPTVSLSVVGSLATGAVMFSALVFLPQYFQFAGGVSTVVSGFLTVPVMLGLLVSTTVVGRLISKYGRWKPYLVGGGVSLVLGAIWLAQLNTGTSYTSIAVGMLLLGTGVGSLLQNLVVITQNAVERQNIGSATAAVTFFRSLGGAVGIALLGAALQAGVAGRVRAAGPELAAANQSDLAAQVARGDVLDPRQLPAPLNAVTADAYGMSIGSLFLILVVFALITVAAVVAIPPAPLSRMTANGPDPNPGQSWSANVFRWLGDTTLLPIYTANMDRGADGAPPSSGPGGPARGPRSEPDHTARQPWDERGHAVREPWAEPDHPERGPEPTHAGRGRRPQPDYAGQGMVAVPTPGPAGGGPYPWRDDTIIMPAFPGAPEPAVEHPRPMPAWAGPSVPRHRPVTDNGTAYAPPHPAPYDAGYDPYYDADYGSDYGDHRRSHQAGRARVMPAWAGDTMLMPVFTPDLDRYAPGGSEAAARPAWNRDTSEWPVVGR